MRCIEYLADADIDVMTQKDTENTASTDFFSQFYNFHYINAFGAIETTSMISTKSSCAGPITVNLCKTATLKKTENWFSKPIIA